MAQAGGVRHHLEGARQPAAAWPRRRMPAGDGMAVGALASRRRYDREGACSPATCVGRVLASQRRHEGRVLASQRRRAGRGACQPATAWRAGRVIAGVGARGSVLASQRRHHGRVLACQPATARLEGDRHGGPNPTGGRAAVLLLSAADVAWMHAHKGYSSPFRPLRREIRRYRLQTQHLLTLTTRWRS